MDKEDFGIFIWLGHWYVACWAFWLWHLEAAGSLFFGGIVFAIGFAIYDSIEDKAKKIAKKKKR